MRARAVPVVLIVLAVVAVIAATHRKPPPPPPAEPVRLVVSSPAICEMLFAIGAGDRVIAVSEFCKEPRDAVAKLPKVGAVTDVDFLAIEALRPDGILVQQSPASVGPLAEFARERGIRIEFFSIETIADVLATLERLGKLTKHEEGARSEVARLSSAVALARASAQKTRPKVLLSIMRKPGEIRDVHVAGRQSFIMECLELAGAEHVFPNVVNGYPAMSKEAVLERQPDIIVELQWDPPSPAVEKALRDDWAATFPDLACVQKGRIAVVAGDALLIPGPRLDRVIDTLTRAIRSTENMPSK